MRIRVVVFGLLAAFLAVPASAQVLPIPPGWQIERTVLLSRHGVSAPLESNEQMKGRFKKTKVGNNDFLTLNLDGGMIPWDQVPIFSLLKQ